MDHDSYSFYSQYHENENENSCEVDQNETDGDALLISLVRDHPYLYNKELTDFKDIMKKQNAWTEIGIILNMTGEECQSRWVRLRERYTREKKQRQSETTTGSGASKRKNFEFFENMTFLEPFVKKRRNFNLRGVKNSSSMIASTLYQQCSNDNVERDSERNLYYENFDSHGGENSSSMIACQQSPNNNLERDSERNILKNISNDRQQMNIFPMSIPVEQSFQKNINSTHLKDSISVCSNDTSSSTLSVSNYIEKNKLSGQRKSKKNSPDIENAICKVTSLLENRYNSSSIASSSPSLKPEATEDMSFCQLVLSLLKNMPEDQNREKKKEILRIIYDM